MPKKSRGIGIVGSRRRNSDEDQFALEQVFLKILDEYDGPVHIVSGGCRSGGDRFAEILAKAFDLPITIHRAKWDRYGKGAGFLRNTFIANDSYWLIACVASDRKGGTEDTIKKFLQQPKAKDGLRLV